MRRKLTTSRRETVTNSQRDKTFLLHCTLSCRWANVAKTASGAWCCCCCMLACDSKHQVTGRFSSPPDDHCSLHPSHLFIPPSFPHLFIPPSFPHLYIPPSFPPSIRTSSYQLFLKPQSEPLQPPDVKNTTASCSSSVSLKADEGQKICSDSLATNRRWWSADGQAVAADRKFIGKICFRFGDTLGSVARGLLWSRLRVTSSSSSFSSPTMKNKLESGIRFGRGSAPRLSHGPLTFSQIRDGGLFTVKQLSGRLQWNTGQMECVCGRPRVLFLG